MRWIYILFLMLLVSTASCAQEPVRPTQRIATIDVGQLDSISMQIRDVASRHGLRVFEKPRAEMRILNQGVDAIFLALYIGDQQVLVVTNVGYGDKLLLAVTPKSGFPPTQADELINEVAARLEQSDGLVFSATNSP